MLNSKDYVDIKLKPEAEKEIFIAQDAMNAHQSISISLHWDISEQIIIQVILTDGTP